MISPTGREVLESMPPLFRSVQNVVGSKTRQVMVYGFHHARYIDISDALEKKDSPVSRVFTWTVGHVSAQKPSFEYTLEGPYFETIPVSQSRGIRSLKDKVRQRFARQCKAGLTNLILENYKRRKTGQPLIPLIFCIGIDGVPSITPHALAAKQGVFDILLTHSELRRLYKHCKEFEHAEEPLLRELAEIAQETVRFVQVGTQGSSHAEQYSLSRVPPVWQDSCWDQEWGKRLQEHPEVRVEDNRLKDHMWRVLFLQKVKAVADSVLASPKVFHEQIERYLPKVRQFFQENSSVFHTNVPTCRALQPSVGDFINFLKREHSFQRDYERITSDCLFERLYYHCVAHCVSHEPCLRTLVPPSPHQ